MNKLYNDCFNITNEHRLSSKPNKYVLDVLTL